jgi:protein-S-isoprenylcysteine O-methyltransferase Ste14
MRMRVSLHEDASPMETNLTAILVLRSTVWLGLMAADLFLAAGDWRWPQGWAFIGIFVLASAASGIWLGRRDPALLRSRLEIVQQGQAAWDKAFLLVFIAIWFGWLALMGLDAGRWRFSNVPVAVNAAGGALVIAGFLATMSVFRANSFAAPVVRVQSERAQRVIDTGPYAIVRHPMYASAIPYLAGIPLLLGSLLGLAVVPLFVIGIAVRSVFEERLLVRELEGYGEYKARVRWRIIPYLW